MCRLGGVGGGRIVVVEIKKYTQFVMLSSSRSAAAAAGAAAGRAAAVVVVAAALVALHVAPDAEGLAAAGERALEGLLARVGVAVDAQRAGPREGLVAGLADVAVLALREGRRRRGGDVVVVLPGVAPRRREGYRDGKGWRECLQRRVRHMNVGHDCWAVGMTHLRKRPLVVETGQLRRWRCGGLHGRIVRGHGRLAHVRRSGVLWLICRGVDWDPRDGSGHVSCVGLQMERWRRLEVVVGAIRYLAHRPRRRRVEPLKGRIRGHGRTWRESRPDQR